MVEHLLSKVMSLLLHLSLRTCTASVRLIVMYAVDHTLYFEEIQTLHGWVKSH